MFDSKHIGWGLLIAGVALSIAEGMAINDATVNGTPIDQSTVGKLEAKIPNPTPFQLGTLLLIGGAFTLWVLPMIRKA